MKAAWYTETQRFNQWWLWILLLLPAVLFFWGIVQQVFMDIPFGDNPAPDAGVLVGGIIPVAIIVLFRVMRLDTTITDTGIEVRFFPLSKKHFSWEDIDQAYIRRYNSLLEFGGWGIRFGSRGTAYNVSGNQGLQLELKNGNRFLVGTQDAAGLKKALMNHGKTQG